MVYQQSKQWPGSSHDRQNLGNTLLLSVSDHLQTVLFPTHFESVIGCGKSCHMPGTVLHA